MNDPTIQILIFGGVVLGIAFVIERIGRKKLHLDERE
jgi:hypothetical protein